MALIWMRPALHVTFHIGLILELDDAPTLCHEPSDAYIGGNADTINQQAKLSTWMSSVSVTGVAPTESMWEYFFSASGNKLLPSAVGLVCV